VNNGIKAFIVLLALLGIFVGMFMLFEKNWQGFGIWVASISFAIGLAASNFKEN
jgi:hypothetical protein